MTENTVYIRKYSSVEEDPRFFVNEKEVWRYAGYFGIPGESEAELRGELEAVLKEVLPLLTYKVCYRKIGIDFTKDRAVLPFDQDSSGLYKCLKGSEKGILFAATVGLGIDRCIARYQRTNKVRALLAQALGAERVEALCDAFCGEIREEACREGLICTNRFSPGYGDLPITCQKEIFRLLDCPKSIGVTLNESLLMSPSKSVTAIFGMGKNVERALGGSKCAGCSKTDYIYRGK